MTDKKNGPVRDDGATRNSVLAGRRNGSDHTEQPLATQAPAPDLARVLAEAVASTLTTIAAEYGPEDAGASGAALIGAVLQHVRNVDGAEAAFHLLATAERELTVAVMRDKSVLIERAN